MSECPVTKGELRRILGSQMPPFVGGDNPVPGGEAKVRPSEVPPCPPRASTDGNEWKIVAAYDHFRRPRSIRVAAHSASSG